MPFEAHKSLLRASELVTVEDAEPLLEWLLRDPQGELDLSACTHLHAANLQVLMAAKAKIAAWPSDEPLANWLRAALDEKEKPHAQDDTGC